MSTEVDLRIVTRNLGIIGRYWVGLSFTFLYITVVALSLALLHRSTWKNFFCMQTERGLSSYSDL